MNRRQIGLLATILLTGPVMAAGHSKAVPTYILDGYSFSGVHGVNAPEMEAKMKDHKGAHVSRADVAGDESILARELKARHIQGHLFTTLAKSNGHAWIIFDLINPDAVVPIGRLQSMNFQGASLIPAKALMSATGLKEGEELSRDNMLAARRAIVIAYAKASPGKKITLKAKLQRTGDKTDLTWIIGEPK